MKVYKKSPMVRTKMPAGFLGLPKPVMIGLALVCFVVAIVVIIISTGGGGLGSNLSDVAGQTVWVKCNNPACGAAYEMDAVEYQQYIIDNKAEAVAIRAVPPMPCKECGERSVYLAIKCLKCPHVFFKSSDETEEYGDKCPECGYSETEELYLEQFGDQSQQ